MKRIHLLAIAALAASSSAFANDVDFYPNGFVSSAIREAHAARVAELARPAGEANAPAPAPTKKSRAQVAAETQEAARLGLLNTGEVGAFQATPEQAHQIELAGLRARGSEAASK
jgi:hypothetical protein